MTWEARRKEKFRPTLRAPSRSAPVSAIRDGLESITVTLREDPAAGADAAGSQPGTVDAPQRPDDVGLAKLLLNHTSCLATYASTEVRIPDEESHSGRQADHV